MKLYIHAAEDEIEQDKDIIAFGDTLRAKGRVGLHDAEKYMDLPGSELIICYRPEYMYMSNPADYYGDGIKVRNSCMEKLENYLREHGFERKHDKDDLEYHYYYTKD